MRQHRAVLRQLAACCARVQRCPRDCLHPRGVELRQNNTQSSLVQASQLDLTPCSRSCHNGSAWSSQHSPPGHQAAGPSLEAKTAKEALRRSVEEVLDQQSAPPQPLRLADLLKAARPQSSAPGSEGQARQPGPPPTDGSNSYLAEADPIPAAAGRQEDQAQSSSQLRAVAGEHTVGFRGGRSQPQAATRETLAALDRAVAAAGNLLRARARAQQHAVHTSLAAEPPRPPQNWMEDSRGSWQRAEAAAQARAVPMDQQRLLQAAVVGAPNAGKSTLLNHFVGSKVSAVSAKTNTTQVPAMGVFTQGTSQVVLFDTPGIVGPENYHNPDHGTRVRAAWSTAAGCDLLVCIVDACRQIVKPDPRVVRLISNLQADAARARPSGSDGVADGEARALQQVLVLNKVDLLPAPQRRHMVADLARRLCDLAPFEGYFAVSALQPKSLQPLRNYMITQALPAPWAMHPAWQTDLGPSARAAEVVREQLFRRLHQEVPYRLRVVPREQKTLLDGSMRIDQDILVPSQSVRSMVVGANGDVVRRVGTLAREELQRIFGTRVHLFLRVVAADGQQAGAPPAAGLLDWRAYTHTGGGGGGSGSGGGRGDGGDDALGGGGREVGLAHA